MPLSNGGSDPLRVALMIPPTSAEVSATMGRMRKMGATKPPIGGCQRSKRVRERSLKVAVNPERMYPFVKIEIEAR